MCLKVKNEAHPSYIINVRPLIKAWQTTPPSLSSLKCQNVTWWDPITSTADI